MKERPLPSVAAAVAAVLVLTCCTATPEAPRFVPSSDGVPIHYSVAGQGEPTLVFVHGWSCDGTYWKAQVPYFSQDHRVVTVDLAGHGDSGTDRKSWSMSAFGQDVAAVVKELDLEQVVLVGHSMGGPVVLEAALQLGERVVGVVGVDAFKPFGQAYTEEQIAAMMEPERTDYAGATVEWVRTNFTPDADPDLVEWVAKDMSSAPPAVALEAAEENYRWYGSSSRSAFQDLKVPIVAITSDVGGIDIAAVREYAPTFDVVVMSGVGHFIMMEDPERFNALLAEAVSHFSDGTQRR